MSRRDGRASQETPAQGDTPWGLLGALTAAMRAWDGSPAEATQQVELARRLTVALCQRLDRSRRAAADETARLLEAIA